VKAFTFRSLRTYEESEELDKIGEQIKERLKRIFEAEVAKIAAKSSKTSKKRLFCHNRSFVCRN
jgi:hypothetical protein